MSKNTFIDSGNRALRKSSSEVPTKRKIENLTIEFYVRLQGNDKLYASNLLTRLYVRVLLTWQMFVEF